MWWPKYENYWIVAQIPFRTSSGVFKFLLSNYVHTCRATWGTSTILFNFQSDYCSLRYGSSTHQHDLKAFRVGFGSFSEIHRQALCCIQFRRRRGGCCRTEMYQCRSPSSKIESVGTDQSVLWVRLWLVNLTDMKNGICGNPRANNLAWLYLNNDSFLKFETSTCRLQSSRAFQWAIKQLKRT